MKWLREEKQEAAHAHFIPSQIKFYDCNKVQNCSVKLTEHALQQSSCQTGANTDIVSMFMIASMWTCSVLFKCLHLKFVAELNQMIAYK